MVEFFRKDKDEKKLNYIDLSSYEDLVGLQESKRNIRLSEIYRYEDLKKLTEYVYNKDILIIDYTPIRDDELTLRRVISELKETAKDVDGDVVSLGGSYLLITSDGIKIDRNKIKF
ncbi:MAG: cell division protein SepF [Thermoplasmata archaeon]